MKSNQDILSDDVLSISRKLQEFFFNIDTSNMLILLLCIGGVSVIFSSINESMISAQSVIIIIITTFCTYIYFKKQFNMKLKGLRLKNKFLKKNSILDDVCNSKKNSKTPLCTKYKGAKRNFYTISNLLLQQYNLKD